MANVHSHIPSKGRKSAAAKPIPSKVMSVEDKHVAEELKLQGGQPEQVQGTDQVQAQPDAPAPDSVSEEMRAEERREHDERRRIFPEQAVQALQGHLTAPVVEEGTDPLHRTPEQAAADFRNYMDEQAKKYFEERDIKDPDVVQQLLKGEAPQPPKLQRLTRNNITRPGAGTKTGTVWDVADEITQTHPGSTAATIAEIKAHAKIRGMNDHTIKTQYARWRAFHGVTGRVTAPVQAQQIVKPPVWTSGFGAAGNFELPAEEQPATAAPAEQEPAAE